MREGYIYILKSPNISTKYIGGTFDTLQKRFSNHETRSNKSSSKIIINAGDASIELYEIFNCNTRLELYKREEEVKQLLILQGIVFVNIRKSGIDAINNPEYNKEYIRKYRDSHKEQIKEQTQAYRDSHKEQTQAYRDSHKEKIKEQRKKYRLRKKKLRNN